jgi:hypothetical protein
MNFPISVQLREPRPDNPSSWRWVIAYFEYVTNHPNAENFLPLLNLVQQLAASEYAQSFRAGQSVWDLVISTAAQNGLRVDEPYVKVTLSGWNIPDVWEVRYYCGRETRDLLESRSCSTKDLFPVVSVFLQRLWRETRGGELPVSDSLEGTDKQPKQLGDN